MPKATRRLARCQKLLKTYIRYHKGRLRRLSLRKAYKRHLRDRASPRCRKQTTLDTLSDLSPLSSTSDNEGSDASGDIWADVLGPEWRNFKEKSLAEVVEDVLSEMPSLRSIGDGSSDSESEPSEVVMGAESGSDGDDEDDSDDEGFSDWEQDDDEHCNDTEARLRTFIVDEIGTMYEHRYEQRRDQLPRGPSYLAHVLKDLKNGRPDHFRNCLRVTPLTFDKLVAKIIDDPIFSNYSNMPQLPVEEQLAVTLFRFGHDGNAASLQKVANWAGLGKGTVHSITRRVMTALLRPEFMAEAVRPPTPAEKEQAKEWVEKHSCKAWRNGWCFVDGTLVPLCNRPYWFGESYFDRKCNYSLNFQIINLPNLRIVDFSYGQTGSIHDATAWEDTRFCREHDTIFEDGEWIWADSAYPINTWIVAPYKKPERDVEENEVFNNHLSMLRIRSEHAIGFLKGRFYSLKNLRAYIKNEKTHKIATYWGAACIAVHAFAMQCEAEERGGDEDVDEDPFIAEGLDSASSDSEANARSAPIRTGTRLTDAKAQRQYLKEMLFRAKARRAAVRASRG